MQYRKIIQLDPGVIFLQPISYDYDWCSLIHSVLYFHYKFSTPNATPLLFSSGTISLIKTCTSASIISLSSSLFPLLPLFVPRALYL